MSSVSDTSGASVVCENIGPRERAKRMGAGVAFSVLGVGLAVTLVATHAGHAWRLTAFLPFAMAGMGIFQARERTCVANVARSVRNMDDGDKPVTDAGEIQKLAQQARRVYVQALVSAAALTALLLLLP